MTDWQPGMTITAERLNDGTDPEEITTGAIAATGFAINEFVARRIGRLVYVSIQVDITTSTAIKASGSTTGNVAGDPTIATLPGGWWPSEDSECSWDTGTVGGGAIISSAGNILIRTITYGQTSAQTDNIRLSTCFIQ